MHYYPYTVEIDQPAAGAEFTVIPSAGDWSRVLSVVATLTTSAVVATRAADLQTVNPTGDLLAVDISQAGQVASKTITYNWRPSNAFYGVDASTTAAVQSCPGFWLPPGAKVSSKTQAKDVGDQWSAITCTYITTDDVAHAAMVLALEQAYGQ